MALIIESERKNKRYKVLYAIIFLFLAVYGCVQFMPLFWLFIGTFKTNTELQSAIPTLFPAVWSLESYKDAFENFNILNNVINTVIVCAGIIILQTTTSTLAAFSLSRIKTKCSNFFFMIILGTQMISATMLLFPTYILLVKMGLIGHKISWILCSSAWGYAILLYKNFFDSIPRSLFEAAEIDGANVFQQIWNIMMPLSKPIFAVNILNTFMAVYNDFLLPTMMLPDEKDWTLMMRIFMMDKAGVTAPNVMYVLLFVTTIPSIVFYLLAQKNIVQGVASSGVKG